MSSETEYLPGTSRRANDQVRAYEASGGAKQGDMRGVPVIILTTCSTPRDVDLAYREHANCYLVKPPTYTALANIIEMIGAFWLDTALLPATRENPR